jgi:ABC-2 type transport system permease protein
MSIITILWLRQIKRYLRSRARIVGSLGQPILFLVALGFGLGPVYERAGGGNYLQLIAPGIIAMSILFTAVFSGIEIIWDRQFGFLKETMVAPVPRWTIMLGRTLGGATVATLQGIIVFCIAFLVGFRPNDMLLLVPALFAMFSIALLFTAVGTAIACKLEDMQGFQLIMNFLVMPLFFLSGALFPLQGIPRGLQIATRIDPLTYGVDALRGLLTDGAQFHVLFDFAILWILIVIALAAGSALFKRIEV